MGIEDRLILLKEPNSIIAESYRTLRATLSRSLAKDKKRFIIVSSWGGEGKSMVSANLAVALSQLLMDVVLVDGDLRRPTISRVFEQYGKPGVMDLLESGQAIDNHICSTPIERLSVLPAGQSNENPGDLLGKGGFQRLMEDPALANKCIVLDTSPLSACSDALLMGPHTDGAIMVVYPAKWQGEAEAHYAQDLEDHGIDIIGVVLNNADLSEQPAAGAYGYGYGYGGYGSEQEARKSRGPQKKGLLSKLLQRLR